MPYFNPDNTGIPSPTDFTYDLGSLEYVNGSGVGVNNDLQVNTEVMVDTSIGNDRTVEALRFNAGNSMGYIAVDGSGSREIPIGGSYSADGTAGSLRGSRTPNQPVQRDDPFDILYPVFLNLLTLVPDDQMGSIYETMYAHKNSKLYITDMNGLMLLKQFSYGSANLHANSFFKSLNKIFEKIENNEVGFTYLNNIDFNNKILNNFFIVKMIGISRGVCGPYVPDSIMVTQYRDIDMSIKSISKGFVKELFRNRGSEENMFKTITRLEVLPNGKAKLTNINI